MSASKHTRAIAAYLLAGLAAATHPSPAAAEGFPRLGLYGSVVGGGYPYVRPDFSLDTLEIGRVARYGQVVLDAFPISPYRPDIVQALKARNPELQVLAYVLAEDIWQVHDTDSLRHIPTIIRRTVRDLDGFLYDRLSGGEYPGLAINIAKRDGSGRFVVAEALADIFRDHILATGLWDGLFADLFCHNVAWTQGDGSTVAIDFQRAGYASLAALDLAWAAATDTLAARLRRDGGPGFVLVGNCGPSAQHARFNGWMRENFPHQQGGTWQSNVLGDVSSRGYLADDRDFVQPPANWILTATTGPAGTEYSAANTQHVRYGLASAALGEGWHTFQPGRSVRDALYHQWWYDEYAVDLASGRSSESLRHTGWLGQALGPARTQVWAGSAPDAITNPGFETSVTSGWTLAWFSPAVASIARDTATAAVGSASARISVTTPSTVEWHTYLASAGQLNTFAGTSYSATFWCKADPPRRLRVLAGNSGGQQLLDVDRTWRQYQAVLLPTTSMLSSLTFFLGTQAGDVWLDDVHFQAGVSSVWRRDFQNGIVLVNPTERALDVPLGMAFRRLLGMRAPAVNSGASGSTMTVGPYDALFLLRSELDVTRPAAVQDLRVGP
jgi:hypothetical protein